MKKDLKKYSSMELLRELNIRKDIYILNWYTLQSIMDYGNSISKAQKILSIIKSGDYGSEDASEYMHDLIHDMTATPTKNLKQLFYKTNDI